MKSFCLLSAFLFLAAPSPSEAIPLLQAIDLTHMAGNNLTVQWPNSEKFAFKVIHKGLFHNHGFDVFVQLDRFSQNSHAGTHMDAPSHFAEGGKLIGEIPLKDLAGPAVVIDIEQKARNNPESMVEVSDLESWESRHGEIPRGAVVVMYSGHGKYYRNQTRYFGYPAGVLEKDPKDTANLHFPSFGPEAAKFLTEKRRILGVAVDTPSLDIGQSRDFQSHIIFANAGIWGIENMHNVDLLPESGYTVYAMVYRLKDNSGGPVRAFALPSWRAVTGVAASVDSAHPLATSSKLSSGAQETTFLAYTAVATTLLCNVLVQRIRV